MDLYKQLPYRAVVDENIENHIWQSTALKMQNLRDLYEAKCDDLMIGKDAT